MLRFLKYLAAYAAGLLMVGLLVHNIKKLEDTADFYLLRAQKRTFKIFATIALEVLKTLAIWPYWFISKLIPSIFSQRIRFKIQSYFETLGVTPYQPTAYKKTPTLPKVEISAFYDLLKRLSEQTNKIEFSSESSALYRDCFIEPKNIQLFLDYIQKHQKELKKKLCLGAKSYVPVRVSKEISHLPYTFQIALIEGQLSLIADVKSKKLAPRSTVAIKDYYRETKKGGLKVVKKSLRLDTEQVLANIVNRKDYSSKVYFNNAVYVSQNKPGLLPYYAGSTYNHKRDKWSLYAPYVTECSSDFSPNEQLMIAQQVIASVQALHDKGIVHFDLKRDNVVIERVGEHVRVSLIDFDGAARVSSDLPKVPAVDLCYAAPEVVRFIWAQFEKTPDERAGFTRMAGYAALEEHKYFGLKHCYDKNPHIQKTSIYQKSADIWSLGCLLENIAPAIKDQTCVRRCFEVDARKRPTIQELKISIEKLKLSSSLSRLDHVRTTCS